MWAGGQRGGTNLQGDAEDKLFAAKEGEIVGPLKGADGYIITKVEGAREGHVPFDKAKRELAKRPCGASRRRPRPRTRPRRRWPS